MNNQELIKKLSIQTPSKIVFLIMDGLGGAYYPEHSGTELQIARHPNMDSLVKDSLCGLTLPIGQGITPGSGPSHVSLFGYDPLKYEIGRGLLDSLGIDFEFTKNDLAARGNFATIDSNGIITDRRAGRISTEINIKLCEKLSKIKINGVEIFVLPVKEHRFSVIFRAENLFENLADSDPQKEGKTPLEVLSNDKKSEYARDIVNEFIVKAKEILKNAHPANFILLRGFSKMLDIPSFQEIYKLKAAAIANYPMYRGIARLFGMNVLKTGDTIDSEFETLKENFINYDYFFMHIKKTDSYGEDGNFNEKVKIIEKVDSLLPVLTELNPDIIVITGDHSTPSLLKGHSWHPVPVLIWVKSIKYFGVDRFDELSLSKGNLGTIMSYDIMSLAMANAGKLIKFGA